MKSSCLRLHEIEDFKEGKSNQRHHQTRRFHNSKQTPCAYSIFYAHAEGKGIIIAKAQKSSCLLWNLLCPCRRQRHHQTPKANQIITNKRLMPKAKARIHTEGKSNSYYFVAPAFSMGKESTSAWYEIFLFEIKDFMPSANQTYHLQALPKANLYYACLPEQGHRPLL